MRKVKVKSPISELYVSKQEPLKSIMFTTYEEKVYFNDERKFTSCSVPTLLNDFTGWIS